MEDSQSNEEDRLDTIEPNTTSRYAVATAPPPPLVAHPLVAPPPEDEVTDQTGDLFAPPAESKSWGDDFFKDPFANSPFNDPARGDPFGFPETERARNGDADAFFSFNNTDSWGEPQTLPDVKAVGSSDNLSHGDMSEITEPSYIYKKEANRGEVGTDGSKENYSTENKGVFAGEQQAEAMRRKNLFAKEQAEAMRTRMLNKQSSPTADPPISKVESLPSSEDEREEKVVSNLMAKSRIISKYGKNRKVARGAADSPVRPPIEPNLLPPRQQSNATRSPVAQPPEQNDRQQETANELALAREQAIARQRAIDIAAAKAKQAGVSSSSYSPKGYRGRSSPQNMRDTSSLSASSSKSPTSYNYPRQKKKVSPSVLDNPSYYSASLVLYFQFELLARPF